MGRHTANKWNPLEVIQGYYVGQVVLGLRSMGVLASLADWQSAQELAAKANLDPELLDDILHFVHKTTDLVRRDSDGRFRLKARYRKFSAMEVHFAKFFDAYGGCLSELTTILQNPKSGPAHVSEAGLAAAFSGIERGRWQSPAAALISRLNVRQLLDLGCGTGGLLAELARRDAKFTGVGVDRNVHACRCARRCIRQMGAEQRISIVHADVWTLDRRLSAARRNRVEALYAGSLLNEFVKSSGAASVSQLLRYLRVMFRDRLMIVGDYYSRLKCVGATASEHRQTLLHDLVQIVSGQGLPPADFAGWRAVYEAADCTVVRRYEGTTDGMTWFFHVIRL